jgi:zinc protease
MSLYQHNCADKRNLKFFKNPGGIFKTFAAAVLVLIFLCSGFSCTARNAGDPRLLYGDLGAPSDPLPFMEKARTGTLSNGLRYYILENTKPENRAFLTLAVDAGSVLEEDDEQGLAHFVEHMAFNGTARFPESELIGYLQSLGMRFGADVNAYTSYDRTVFGIEVPVEKDGGGIKRIPGKALDVMDDWTHRVTFAPKDVEEERQVIMEEYRSRLGAYERVSRQMFPVLFRGSPYAERLPIGLEEIIRGAPPERLEGFYKKWYRPDNMALIIVGDFDGSALEEDLGRHSTAPSPAGDLIRPRYTLPEPVKGSLETLAFSDPELPLSDVELYFKRPSLPPQSSLAAYRAGVIDDLIDHILALRFEEASVKPEAPYLGAGAGPLSYGYGSRYYVLAAQAKASGEEDNFILATLRELLTVKESLLRYGFTQAELERAKGSLLSRMERLVSEKDRQESSTLVWQFTEHFLEGGGLPDVEWEFAALKILLPRINLKDLSQTVKDYFSGEDLRVFLLAPESEKDKLPDLGAVEKLAAEVRRAKIAPPAEERLGESLLDEAPVPGEITGTRPETVENAYRWELGNGAEIILQQTKNRNNEIQFYAQARGGTGSVDEREDTSASLGAEMLNVSGLGPYSLAELSKFLADKQVSLSFWTSDFLRGFQGSATSRDIKTLFEMLYLFFTQPRFDGDAVKAMMDQYRTTLIQEAEDPDSFFSREITRTIYGANRFHPMELEDLSRINPDDALAFVKTCMNPGDYTFVFTGNLDMEQMRSLVETYLASIPRGTAFNEWADLDFARPGKAERILKKGAEERSVVYLGYFVPMEYSEEAAAAAAVLTEYLDIRLTREIREKLGGVYSISVRISLSAIPGGELSGGIYFVCDPKRVDELSAAIGEEFKKAADGGLDPDSFRKAVEALIKEHERSIQDNSHLAQSYANSAVIYRSGLDRLTTRPARYAAVKPGDAAALMVRLLQDGPVRVVLYPEK